MGTEALPHKDPFGSLLNPDLDTLKNKKIIRTNIIIQNAKRGGNFDLHIDNRWITLDIPDRGLMTFNASDTEHRITKNLSSTPRLNLSIDCVEDR